MRPSEKRPPPWLVVERVDGGAERPKRQSWSLKAGAPPATSSQTSTSVPINSAVAHRNRALLRFPRANIQSETLPLYFSSVSLVIDVYVVPPQTGGRGRLWEVNSPTLAALQQKVATSTGDKQQPSCFHLHDPKSTRGGRAGKTTTCSQDSRISAHRLSLELTSLLCLLSR